MNEVDTIFQHLLEAKDILINIGEAMEKSDPSYTTGETVNGVST